MLTRVSTDRASNGKQTFAYNVNTDKIYITLSDSIHTATDANAYLSTNNVEIAYYLASPVSYELTSQQVVSLLKGQNVLWSTTGPVSIEYPADTRLYIEKLTKPTEDDMIANNNIASGKFFMINNTLYLSSAAIASGEAIVPGTNCTEISLADALNNLSE